MSVSEVTLRPFHSFKVEFAKKRAYRRRFRPLEEEDKEERRKEGSSKEGAGGSRVIILLEEECGMPRHKEQEGRVDLRSG
ncbi:hypothetical protein V1478_018369 [Vespula squamosa]|uniref:Uncharacterized protein n=1 Tax=Vespula squamosa TaxID=30214 RepID=A0ABD1ZUV4_VESSQ